MAIGAAMLVAAVVVLVAARRFAERGYDKQERYRSQLFDAELSALTRLRDLETLIVVGDKDLLTPVEHSRRMADALPNAELLILQGAGHLAMMERPEMVTLRLRAFLHRAYRSAAGGVSRGVR